jgi:hypothetical protein
MTEEVIIDLSNYKDRVGSRVMPGTYRVQVEDAENTESANKNPMINLWFTILEGEFAGQTVTDRLVLTEKSMFRVVGFMQAIGLPTPKKRIKLNTRQFVGRTLDIEVDDGDPYNGRVRSEVRGYRKIAGAAAAKADLDDLPETDASASDLPAADDAQGTTEAAEATTAIANEQAADAAAAAQTADDDSLDLDSVQL